MIFDAIKPLPAIVRIPLALVLFIPNILAGIILILLDAVKELFGASLSNILIGVGILAIVLVFGYIILPSIGISLPRPF